jgi:hypothetical protein
VLSFAIIFDQTLRVSIALCRIKFNSVPCKIFISLRALYQDHRNCGTDQVVNVETPIHHTATSRKSVDFSQAEEVTQTVDPVLRRLPSYRIYFIDHKKALISIEELRDGRI